jgi:PIN domain nuclease of toxin-antitoxin system
MQFLLDTHTFIWFSENDRRLSKRVANEVILTSKSCFTSIASLWEIAIKSQIGKL